MNRKRISIRLLICMAAAVVLTACAAPVQQPPQPPQPVTVYDDGVYTVEVLSTDIQPGDDGTVRADILLRVTNGALDDLALSSLLCFAVGEESADCQLTPIPEGCVPIDGLIPAGASAEGCISAQLPPEQKSLQIKIAVDYLGDQWVEFWVVSGE